MKRAVLFDYGLTLVDFTYPRECLLETLAGLHPELQAAAGVMPEPEEILSRILKPIESHLDRFGEDEVDYLEFFGAAWRGAGLALPADLLYRVLDAEQRCWDRAVTAAPHALEALAELRARGIVTAICSNAPFPPEMMRRQVRENGFADLVDCVVFSSDVGRRKPAPEPYLAALDQLGVGASEALHVGDRVVEDYEGPRQVGIDAVLCTALARHPVPDGVPTIATLAQLTSLL